MRSPIRDLVRQIEDLAREHGSFSAVQHVISNTADHMSAIARLHELNERQLIPRESLPTGSFVPSQEQREKERSKLANPVMLWHRHCGQISGGLTTHLGNGKPPRPAELRHWAELCAEMYHEMTEMADDLERA